MTQFRIEKDSMGEVNVPVDAFYAAQTQRAKENFPISDLRFDRAFIQALGYVKQACALVNKDLGMLPAEVADYIVKASQMVVDGEVDDHFVVDVFQTGSGTSTNMNVNEVIANRANFLADQDGAGVKIHPNDHVNFGQSSNDVFPTAIRVSALLAAKNQLIPALEYLKKAFHEKGQEYADVVKTGRTHLMDAMPLTIAQQFGGYERQLELGIERVKSALVRLAELPQGGTAIGTGINTHEEFGKRFAEKVSELTGADFIESVDHFEAQATIDAPVETSGQLKTIAVGLMKMANDLRWMNSGPNSGLGEIQLKALQPGSSIMPGKVNPVIEESVTMVCAQVIGNDTTIMIGGQSGNFELNVMLPVVGYNLNQSIVLLANVARNFADQSVSGILVKKDEIADKIGKNPILVTALNPIIGYDLAAKIAKTAFAEGRPLKEVALEMTDLSEAELDSALDPIKMTKGGFTD
ncbi:class II fumarate hydratase [Balneolaceae bacterium ANBcel3]|nr:class II fumarate hydratase [Balneolaceae bacterium ANBcel3]